MLSANLLSILHDQRFPGQAIRHLSAAQFQDAEDKLLDHLYQALSQERQAPENKQLLEKALTYKINASSDELSPQDFLNQLESLSHISKFSITPSLSPVESRDINVELNHYKI